MLLLAAGITIGVPAQAQDSVETEPPLERAQQLLNSGSYLAAIELFRRVDGMDEELAILGLSRAFAQTGQYEQAIEVLEDTISGYADFSALSTQLA
jgi:thioredoxin-like negative regulator of GroEL